MPESVVKSQSKIKDVILVNFINNHDSRGCFTELFREAWFTEISPIQWNAVKNNAGILRGFHAHKRHSDYLTVISGTGYFFIKDLRKNSGSSEVEEEFKISNATSALIIPPGVGHMFYFPEESIHIYSVTHYWDKSDELGCRFNDQNLKFNLENKNPIISEHDQKLGSYEQLIEIINH